MRLYIDLSCFNRPFDNQHQERIRQETETIFEILNRVVEGKDNLIWSWVLTFENSRHPRPDRRDEIQLWQSRADSVIAISPTLDERARELSKQGIPALDAAHVASAEAARADLFLTCDDQIVRRAKRLELTVRVMNPMEYWKEVLLHG